MPCGKESLQPLAAHARSGRCAHILCMKKASFDKENFQNWRKPKRKTDRQRVTTPLRGLLAMVFECLFERRPRHIRAALLGGLYAFIGKESAYRNRRKSRNPTQPPGIKIPLLSKESGDSFRFTVTGNQPNRIFAVVRRRGRANTVMSGNQRLS